MSKLIVHGILVPFVRLPDGSVISTDGLTENELRDKGMHLVDGIFDHTHWTQYPILMNDQELELWFAELTKDFSPPEGKLSDCGDIEVCDE